MLDFIRDIYSSFRQTSLERIKSPFLGAFVFSWIGFNWQMLAVVLFSKKSIEDRLETINNNFGIGDYLVGPILTTALIVIILPQINKVITRIQDTPNSDTISLSLKSKIKIAHLQQALAESEAKKKLAEKREERFIEENITLIKESFDKANSDLQERERQVKSLFKESNELRGQLAKAESKFNVEKESKVQIQNEIIIEKENNRILGEQIISLSSEVNKYKSDLTLLREAYDDALKSSREIQEKAEKTENSIRKFNMRFPTLTNLTDSRDGLILRENKDATSGLRSLNNILTERYQKNKMKDI